MTNRPHPPQTPLTYRDAGVDIDAGEALVDRIKPLAAKTLREGVLSGIGGFGALFELPSHYRQPVLVSGTDGVGTKLRLAFDWNQHNTVGIDLVAMSVNDILVQGAEPLFFLDYFACGKLSLDIAQAVVEGIAEGCQLAGCALIGGETAEMPGMYPDGEYDLAGFALGAVEKAHLLDGSGMAVGDTVLGLASSGAHSNGYSLIRRILDHAGAHPEDDLGGERLQDVVMAPTRIYVKSVLAVLEQHRAAIKGLAHITGGGLLDNLPRILGSHLGVELNTSSWQRPVLFDWLQAQGRVTDLEMHRVFNCGIGMAMVVDSASAAAVSDTLQALGETVFEIGRVVAHKDKAAPRVSLL